MNDPLYRFFRQYAVWCLGDKQGLAFRLSVLGSYLPLIGLPIGLFLATENTLFAGLAVLFTVYFQIAWPRLFDEMPDAMSRWKPAASDRK